MFISHNRRPGWRVGAVVLGVVSLAALTGCSANGSAPASSDKPDLKIGVDVSLTGPFAFAGVQELAGIKLAAASINDAGGVDGRPVDLVILDDTSAPDQSVLNLRKLAQQDNVVAIVGPGSSNAAVTGAQTANALKVPTIALASSVGDVWEGASTAKWAFGIAGTGQSIGSGCMADFVKAEKAKGTTITSVAVGEETAVNMQTYAAGVVDYAKSHGIKVVGPVDWAGDSTDVSTQVAQLIAAKTDAIEFSALQQTNVLAMKALDQQGALGSTPIVNCSALDLPSFYQALGAAVQRPDYYTQFLLADAYPEVKTGAANDKQRQLVIDALAKYGKKLDIAHVSQFAMGGWEALYILTNAVHKAGSTERDAVRTAVEKTDVHGAQSDASYSPTQHRPSPKQFSDIAKVLVFGPGGKLTLPSSSK